MFRCLAILLLSPLSFAFGSTIPLKLGAESQSLQTAYECVNVLSGTYFEVNSDVEIGGAAPLSFTRCYETSSKWYQLNWKGINQMLSFPLDACATSGFLAINQREGAFLKWKPTVRNGVAGGEIDPEVYEWGHTNFSGRGLSGQLSLKNQSMQYLNNKTMEVTNGSGGKYLYQYSYFDANHQVQQWILVKEIKPNGHRVHFDYAIENGEPCLRHIKTTNSSETLTFNSIAITRQANGKDHTVLASNGESAHYKLRIVEALRENRMERPWDRRRVTQWLPMGTFPCLAEVSFSHKSTITYGEQRAYELGYKKINPAFLHINLHQGVEGRYRTIHYCGSSGRVTALQAPLGTDQTPITQATFAYAPTYTSVKDAYGNETIYRFVNPKRIGAIEKWTKNKLYSAETFYWGNSGSLQGNLLARGIKNEKNKHLTCMVGCYDDRGNVIREELYGNLTGQTAQEFELGQDFRPQNVDCYATTFQYSADGFNLPLREEHPDGKVICYRYLPGTDRLVAKLTGDKDRFFLREFHRYSDDPLLLESLFDDGSGSDPDDLTDVTSRKIVRVTPRYEAPAVGSPARLMEAYLDLVSNREHQLHRIDYHYEARDLVIQEDHYDAHDQPCFSLQYTYDEQKNLVAKSDALGRIILMRYDANHNKLSEELVGSGYHAQHTYDYANRLIKTEEIHEDGLRLVTCFRYDYLNRKIATIDPFGNETRHIYDAYGREIEIDYPPHQTPQGTLVSSCVKKQYNILDQLVAITDQNGHTTHTSYTIRGQPTRITHPNDTQERFEYNLNGTLAKKWEVNGLCHHYTYDILGRLLRTDSYDSLGTLQTTLCQEYKGNYLIRVINSLGVTTEYAYDGAGRKILELCDTQNAFSKTAYSYDSLGRLDKTTRWVGPQETVTQTQEYDLADRLISMQVEDEQGNILRKETYAYDIRNNRILTRVFSSPTESSLAQVEYNSHNLPIRLIDDLGNTIHISYDFKHRNRFGQTVLSKTTTDPLGRKTITIQDTLGRIQESHSLDPLGNLLAQYQLWHDPVGQPIRRVDDVIAEGKVLRQQITEWVYDALRRPIQLREAVGTSEERLTTRSYNPYGQLETIHLPDGLAIWHTYDPMGRLAHYYASDNSFAYRYQYDALGQVLSVEDSLHNTYTHRRYDSLQRITQETLGNGLTLHYQYDGLNRQTRIQLPDSSAIAYRYDAANLLEIIRLCSDGSPQYSHRILSHDLRGKPLTTEPVGSGTLQSYARCAWWWPWGQSEEAEPEKSEIESEKPQEPQEPWFLNTTYDRLGRPQSITSPYHSDTIPEHGYDPVGNMVERQLTDPLGHTPHTYHYDNLDQLTDENGTAQHQYQHDSLNNRLSKDGMRYELNALNLLIQVDKTLYLYDRRGNLIQSQTPDQTTHYRYDALGRLLELETPQTLHRYQYDSFNRRLSSTTYTKHSDEWVEQETTHTLYAGQNDIGALSNDQIIRLRLLGEGRGAEIGAAVALELAGKVYTPLHDLCGNVIALIDSQTNLIAESYRYSAFGEEQLFASNGTSLSTSAIGNPWRYSSKYVDEDTGLVFFGRRYFNPTTGRWLTPDPLGYEAGPNLYAYVHNNPLIYADLYGLFGTLLDFGYSRSSPWCGSSGNPYLSSPENTFSGSNHSSRYGGYRQGNHTSQGLRERSVPSFPFTKAPGTFKVPGRSIPNLAISWGPGQKNTSEEAHKSALRISELHGGYEVHGLDNPTYGGVLDTMGSAWLKLGLSTPAAFAQAVQWTDLYNSMSGPERMILHYCHSQGASITVHASQWVDANICRSIHVRAFGPSEIVEKGQFGSSENTISNRDPVSLGACFIRPMLAGLVGYATMPSTSNVRFVQGSGFYDHPFLGSTYENEVRKMGFDFQKLYLGE